MNLIIPFIMLVAIICIMYKTYKERASEKLVRANKEAQIRRQIETKVLSTVRGKSEYWDRFNIGLYVEFLEVTNQ